MPIFYPRTPKDAAASGLIYYWTGRPCRHGHIALRHTSSRACVRCSSEEVARFRAAHPDHHRSSMRRYRAQNPDAYRATDAAKYERHKATIKVRSRAYYEATKADFIFRVRKRQLSKRRATPSWADQEAIRAIYRECRRVTRETGIQHHVDHVIPLAGETVCGLHVPDNLRIIPAVENLKKHRRFAAE